MIGETSIAPVSDRIWVCGCGVFDCWCTLTISVIYLLLKGGGDCLPVQVSQQAEDRRIAEATETVDASLTQKAWVRPAGGAEGQMLKC